MNDSVDNRIRIGQAINLAWEYAALSGAVSLEETLIAADGAVEPILGWINRTQVKFTMGEQSQRPPTETGDPLAVQRARYNALSDVQKQLFSVAAVFIDKTNPAAIKAAIDTAIKESNEQ